MASDTSLVFNIIAKDKASKTFDKIKGTAAVAGVAIGAALTAGVAQMLEQSKTSALLQAQLGAGTPIARQAGEAAGAVYAHGIAGSMEEASSAVRAAVQNALVPPDASSTAIDAVASKIVNLGTVMEEDADRVSSAVSQMIRTGMVKSAEEGFDLLQKGVEGGVNKSQDLLDTFNEYGTQFRALGINGPQAMGLLSQSIKAGARDSDVAADALKEFQVAGVSGSAKAAAGFKALGLDAKKMTTDIAAGGPTASAALGTVLDKLRDMPPSAEKSAAATALFGTKSEDLQAALSGMNLNTATTELGKVAGAADNAGNTLEQSAGAKLEAFKRQAQAALVDQLAKAVPYIDATFGWLSRNSSWVTPLATALGIFAAVIGTIVAITRVWTAVQTALNIVMALNPIGLVILAIVALIAIIVLIATKTTWFQTLWKYIWDKGIKAAAVNTWNWIKSTALALWNWIKAVPGWISGKFAAAWNWIKTTAGAAWGWVKTKVTTFYNWITGLPGRISSKLSSMWNGLKSGFKAAINWVIGKWNNLSFGIPGFSFAGMSVPGISIGTPNIPYLAKGGVIRQSGLAVVGERGPEMVSLSKGAQVTPLRRQAVGGTQRLVVDVTGADAEMVRLFRKLFRTANLVQS
jgi:phage-related minor tail protein